MPLQGMITIHKIKPETLYIARTQRLLPFSYRSPIFLLPLFDVVAVSRSLQSIAS